MEEGKAGAGGTLISGATATDSGRWRCAPLTRAVF
jgi:hypothetical protein